MADETLTYAMRFDIGDAKTALADAQQRVAELHQTWEGLSDAERAAIEDFTAAKDALKLQAEAAGITTSELVRLRGALESAAQAEKAQAAAAQEAAAQAAAAAAAAAQRTAELSAAYDSLSSAERDAIAEMQRAKEALSLQAEAAGITVGELTRLRGALEGAAEAERQTAQAIQAATDAEQTRMAAASKRAAALKGVSADEVTAAKAIRDQRSALTAQAEALGISTAELAKMRSAISDTAPATKSMAKAIDKGTDSVGAMRAASGNLRNQLFDIYVQLQGGQNPFTVISQQGPQIVDALDGVTDKTGALTGALGPLGGALKAALGFLGPLAIAASAAALAFTVYKIETAKANETSDAMNRSLERLQGEAEKTAKALDRASGSWQNFSGLRTNLEQRLDVLSGLRSQTEIDRENLRTQIEAETMPTIDALGKRLAQTEAQLSIKQEQLKGIRSRAEGEAIEAEIANLEALSRHTEKRLEQAKMQRQEALYLVDAVADAEIAEENRAKAAKETEKSYKKQTKELEKQKKAEERDIMQMQERQATELRQMSIKTADSLSSLRQADPEALQRAQKETGITITGIQSFRAEAKTTSDFAILDEYIRQLGDAVKRAADGIEKETKETKDREDLIKALQEQREQEQANRDAMLQQTAGVLGSAAGGDITSLLSMAGPQGAAIGQGLELVKAFADPENNPFTQVEDFLDALMAGLKNLPRALSTQLPQLFRETIPEVLEVLIDEMDAIVAAAVDALFILQEELPPKLIAQIDELIISLIRDVLPEIVRIDKSEATQVAGAFKDSIVNVIQGLAGFFLDPEVWANAFAGLRAAIGTALGSVVSNSAAVRAALGALAAQAVTAIGESLRQVFTVDFWREVLAGLIEAIRGFSLADLDTPGIDAFRAASGLDDGTRQGIASRARSVVEGGRSRVQNISVSGAIGDPRSLRRFLRNISLRRDGVGSIG